MLPIFCSSFLVRDIFATERDRGSRAGWQEVLSAYTCRVASHVGSGGEGRGGGSVEGDARKILIYQCESFAKNYRLV